MRKRLGPPSALVFLLVLAPAAVSLAYEHTESICVVEPWSGWWWPWYHPDWGPDPYQHHMWEGPNINGGPPGPIYDFDTKYFWWPQPKRDSAQNWEFQYHHTTSPDLMWAGHCAGVSMAQAMESDPPADCGALTQDDLEGLLGETWMDSDAEAFGDGTIPIYPSDMWNALRHCLGVLHRPFVVDFHSDGPASDCDIEWNFPVFGCGIQYNVEVADTICRAVGEMTLHIEGHLYGVPHAPREATYSFWCQVKQLSGIWFPVPQTGDWLECHGPCDPPDDTLPPQNALLPLGRKDYDTISRNPHIDYDTLKRVIDHKTIVLDDEYGGRVNPGDPGWETRPGYAGSCWAARGVEETWPAFYFSWYVDSSIPKGMWDIYIYKTLPSDVMNTQTKVSCFDYYHPDTVDQSSPPFDVWEYLRTVHIDEDWEGDHLTVLNFYAQPLPCWVYFDAMKLEWKYATSEGAANSSTVVLDDVPLRLRVSPNPVGRTASISYAVSKPGRVDVVVYDVAGRAVLRAAQGIQRAGLQSATISVAELPAGTYMARVSAAGVHTACRFVVCR